VPERSLFVEIALALLGLLLLNLNINFTTKVIWRQFPPKIDKQARTRIAYHAAGLVILFLAILCFGAGSGLGYLSSGWDGVWRRILSWHILIAICL
jgi:hypothetical protein